MNFNPLVRITCRAIILPLTAIALFLTSFAESADKPQCSITIINEFKKTIPLTVEIADTPEKRQTGLMFRKSMPADRGMLFVFESDAYLNFWMKNTHIPLSIAYIDKNGYIIDIYHMEPLNALKTYPSKKTSRYALEVNLGWFHENNITPGCRILLDGCFSK